MAHKSIQRKHKCGSRQLARRQQASPFHHGPFAMHPLGFDRIEPGASRRQLESQEAHPRACLFDLLMAFSDQGLHDFAEMPGGMIPDQQPGVLPLRRQLLAAPVEKLSGDVADWTHSHKTKPYLIALRIVWLPLLPQDAITDQRFGIGVALFSGLFFQTHRILFTLPGVHARKSKALHHTSSRNLIAQSGCWLPQAIKLSQAFFSQVLWIGTGNPVFGALPVGKELPQPSGAIQPPPRPRLVDQMRTDEFSEYP